EARVDEAHRETDELTRQLTDIEGQLTRVREQAEGITHRREKLARNLEGKEQRLRQKRNDLEATMEAIEQENRNVADAERSIAQVDANLRAIAQRQRDLEERSERCKDESGKIVDRVAALRGSAMALDGELGGLRMSKDQLETRRADAQARRAKLVEEAGRDETELEVMRTELHRRKSRLTSLEEIQRRYEGFGRGTRAIMERANGNGKEKGIIGLVADMVEAPESYETALEAVLGQRLGGIVVEDQLVGRESIEYLKEQAEGRSSFIPRFCGKASALRNAPVGVVWEAGRELPANPEPPAKLSRAIAMSPGVHGPMLGLIKYVPEHRQVAEGLLGDVIVVENFDHALMVWDHIDTQTIVTLDGEILEPNGMVTGGSLEAENSGVLPQKREIKELRAIIASLEEDYKKLLDRHLAQKAAIVALEQVLEEATRNGHQDDKDILTREKDLGSIQSEIDARMARRQEIDCELEQISQALDEIERQRAALNQTAVHAAEQKWICADILYLLAHEKIRLLGLVDAASTEVLNAKVGLAEAAAICQAIEENVRQLQERYEDRVQRIRQLEQSATDGQDRAANLRQNVEEIEKEIRNLVGERAGCEEELSQCRKAFEDHMTQVCDLEVSLKELRSKVNDLGARIGKLQIRASELRMGRKHLEDQIWERYHENLAKVAGDYHLRPMVTEEQSERLDKLREILARMGEVNLFAIEECEKLSERFEFLSGHKKDLEDALSQLQSAIQKINRTSRKRFRETFENVNAQFQELFPRLFNGGRAHLVLTETTDVLEAGVDIVAQPPGKKLQSIEMMSGGEKALTAVSLIFAMFLVKPTPFCLLDEVDAPLDDANIIRFTELVAEMSKNSQFILITHNRGTMEIADRLYGVTMEEPGVSKVVSVNLEQAEEAVAA
ncbi:MAG: chromosome segregation protein SMC, partial [Pseudomonadota bacterium]